MKEGMKYRLRMVVFIVITGCAIHQQATNLPDGYTKTASGLQYKILQKGTGDTAKAGQEVLIFETTTYLNGTVLYSNYDSTSPVKVLIGGTAGDDVFSGYRRHIAISIVQKMQLIPLFLRKSIKKTAAHNGFKKLGALF